MDQVEEIKLSVPAIPTYSRVVRLAITGLGSRVGFSYDEIEDLRIAIGEVCSVLLDEGGGRLTFTCRLGHQLLAVDAVREPAGPPLAITELTTQILAAVVDVSDIDPATARISVLKRRRR